MTVAVVDHLLDVVVVMVVVVAAGADALPIADGDNCAGD